MTIALDVARITAHLARHGSAARAAGIQWFFKETIHSHGWRTADLRRYAASISLEWAAEPRRLVRAADRLFRSTVLEEKIVAVLLLQRVRRSLGTGEFSRFEGWLDHVSSWADHDALTMFLIGPLMTADPGLADRTCSWAVSPRRWHRRAAAVSLIDGIRHGLFTQEATNITYGLMSDPDDMVRKGLGWLLREWGKVRPAETVPLLMTIRPATSRIVLRTACERLPAADRHRILAKAPIRSSV